MPAPLRSWASVVAHSGDPGPGHSAAVPGEPVAAPGDSTAVLHLLQPLLATQAEVLGTELQAMFAARLEDVFQPLRDLVASMQGWTTKV
jgi:hypothetical protein